MKHYSKQREMILRAVREHPVHPTAEEVLAILRAQGSTASLSTVYRNLQLLSEKGLLRKISVPGGSDRFDGELHEHFHALCRGCGRVADVQYPLPGLAEAVRAQTGMQADAVHLTVRGLCPRCAAAQAEGSRTQPPRPAQ